MNVLFLTHRLPYAPNRGDRIRAYHLLRAMSRFARVSLFSLVHDDEELAHAAGMPFAADVRVARVRRARNILRGAATLPFKRPLTHALLDASEARRILGELRRGADPDVVLAYCSGMARFAGAPPLADLPCVIDLVDVDSAKWAMLADSSRGLRRWIYRREASTLGAFEAEASRRARMTLVVNDREREALLRLAPQARVTVVPNGIDVDSFAPKDGPETAPRVIFCGVMDYPPNAEGVIWFAKTVWPHVLSKRPDARFVVVGAAPTRAVKALERDPTIQIVGGVDRVQPYLWRAAVAIAPLHMARGLQNKVLEALAAGLPVVVAPAVFEGLPREARHGCRCASTAQAFASELITMLQMDPADRRQLAERANVRALHWDDQLGSLEAILG